MLQKTLYKTIAFFSVGLILFGSLIIGFRIMRKVIPLEISACSSPLRYSIGSVDDRFKITPEELLLVVRSAELVWEKSLGINLFEHDPAAAFKINLVFDERQQQTLEAAEAEAQLEVLKSQSNLVQDKFESANVVYQKKRTLYETHVAAYEHDLKIYNAAIKKWNERGGAPPDEYKKLQKEQQALQSRAAELEKERRELNRLAGQTNTAVQQGNTVIQAYNAKVETYQSRFGTSREFEQGVYQGESINLYQFREKNDLKALIVHELGHALGIGHLDNPQAIMNRLLKDQDLKNLQLTRDDVQAAEAICKPAS